MMSQKGNVTHLCILALEVSVAVRESSDLCWAHKGEVQRVEEEHDILALQADAILASATPATICSSLSASGLHPLLAKAMQEHVKIKQSN